MSLGGKYVFVTVMCLVLPMCILISCSSMFVHGLVVILHHRMHRGKTNGIGPHCVMGFCFRRI